MKRNLLMLLLGGMVMLPSGALAQSGSDDNNQNFDNHRSPAHNPHVLISYDESIETALVTFNSAVDNAEILVYQNGVEVDYQLLDAAAGTQIPLDLSAYGTGEITIQVKRYSTLLATYSITL